jgi:hypothetical protein
VYPPLEEAAIEAENFKKTSKALSDIGGRGCKNMLTPFFAFGLLMSGGNRR